MDNISTIKNSGLVHPNYDLNPTQEALKKKRIKMQLDDK